MPVHLPTLSADAFRECLLGGLGGDWVDESAVERLHAHYVELVRWARRTSLVGPKVGGFVERHYTESLVALPYLPARGRLVDVGSGAGFPGLILSLARPALVCTLVEPREKRRAFLAAAARKAALRVDLSAARVGAALDPALPSPVDVFTVRALKLGTTAYAAMAERLGDTGQILAWVGREDPVLPPGLESRVLVSVPGSEHRRILRIVPQREGSA